MMNKTKGPAMYDNDGMQTADSVPMQEATGMESADGRGNAIHGNGEGHPMTPVKKLTALWKTFCGVCIGTEGTQADADKGSGGSRSAAKNHALRRLIGQVCGVLAFFVLALFFTQARLMYEVQPLGIALLCAAAPTGIAAAGGGVLLSLLAQGVGEGQVGSLYLGAAAIAVGMRYAVGRLLVSSDADDRFGAANSRKRRQLRRSAASGAMGDDGGPGDLAASLVRLGRAAFPSGVFAQSIAARVGISVLAAAPIAIGFLLGDTAGGVPVGRAVFVMAAVPAFTYLFCGIADGRHCPPALREAGIGAVCYALTASCGGAILFGFSVKLLAAHAITLAVSKRGGYLRGALTGLLCGFACDTLYAPAFALIGAAAGVLWNVHAAAAVLVSLAVGGAYAVYVGAFPAIRAVLPEMIVVSAAAYPLIRYLPDVQRRLQLPGFPSDAEEAPVQMHGTGEALSDGIAVTPELLGIPPLAVQLDALSGILRGLSSTFYHLSDRTRKPGLYEVRQLCEGISDRYCTHCAHHELCWEKEFSSTADAMGRITLCIHRKGRAEAGAAFAPLDRRCPNLPKMLAAMNDAAAVLCEEKITKDKTETAAGDYEGMAKLLRASAEESAQACKKDTALSRRMGRAMARIGFRAASVSVYGTRRRTVVAEGIDLGMGEAQDFLRRGGDLLLGTEELCEAFSALSGVRYQPPEYHLTAGGKQLCMTMRAGPKLSVSGGCWGEKKAGEEVTGDVACLFANRSDYFYALVCDGMGSGREASVTAQISALFLEKLLSVSTARGAALNLLNGFLRARSGECSATVDLCEIDMITGEAKFVKCGAAASYLMRGEQLFRIASGTMPLGILREVSAEETAFPLCGGDLLLFFSDGVCGEEEDSSWITSVVRQALDAYALRRTRSQARAAVLDTDAAETDAENSSTGGVENEDAPMTRAAQTRNSPMEALAQALGTAAMARTGRRDDMTVAVLQVQEIA